MTTVGISSEQILQFLNVSEQGLGDHPVSDDEREYALDDGLLILTAPDLESGFLFVKVDADRGIVGGQKAGVRSFIGSADRDAWRPAGDHRTVALAVASVINIYRHFGR